jgi:hypothetical protein
MRSITTILCITVAGATASAEPWTMGVEPRFGMTIPTSKLTAMAVGGLEVDYALPVANHQLVAALDFGLTRPSYDASASDPRIPGGMTAYTIHQTEMVIGAVASYRLAPADHTLIPHVGAGPLLHLLKTNETAMLAPGENTATQTKLGVEAVLGLDYTAGPGLLAADLRFLYSGLDTPLTGGSNAGNVELAVGYRFVF